MVFEMHELLFLSLGVLKLTIIAQIVIAEFLSQHAKRLQKNKWLVVALNHLRRRVISIFMI